MEIFSLLMQLFMGHIVPCLHLIERENIFSSCVSSTQFFFKTWFMSFYLSPPPLFFPKTVFSQNLFCFSYFYRGREIFFNLCDSYGEMLLFIGGVVSIFSYSVAYVFCLSSDQVVFVNTRQKGGDIDDLLVLFRGRI